MDPWPVYLDSVCAGPFDPGVCPFVLNFFVTVGNSLAAGFCRVYPFFVGTCHYTVGLYVEDRISAQTCRSDGDSLGTDILDPLTVAYRAHHIYDRGDHYGNGVPFIWCHMASA